MGPHKDYTCLPRTMFVFVLRFPLCSTVFWLISTNLGLTFRLCKAPWAAGGGKFSAVRNMGDSQFWNTNTGAHKCLTVKAAQVRDLPHTDVRKLRRLLIGHMIMYDGFKVVWGSICAPTPLRAGAGPPLHAGAIDTRAERLTSLM